MRRSSNVSQRKAIWEPLQRKTRLSNNRPRHFHMPTPNYKSKYQCMKLLLAFSPVPRSRIARIWLKGLLQLPSKLSASLRDGQASVAMACSRFIDGLSHAVEISFEDERPFIDIACCEHRCRHHHPPLMLIDVMSSHVIRGMFGDGGEEFRYETVVVRCNLRGPSLSVIFLNGLHRLVVSPLEPFQKLRQVFFFFFLCCFVILLNSLNCKSCGSFDPLASVQHEQHTRNCKKVHRKWTRRCSAWQSQHCMSGVVVLMLLGFNGFIEYAEVSVGNE